MDKLLEGAKLADVIAAVNLLVDASAKKRDRGPDSEREMTDEDALAAKAMFAKGTRVKDIVKAMPGLSYGQIYSCVNGFTFKKVKVPA